MREPHFSELWAAKTVLGRAAGLPAKSIPESLAEAKALQMMVSREVRASRDPEDHRRDYKREYMREYMRRRRGQAG